MENSLSTNLDKIEIIHEAWNKVIEVNCREDLQAKYDKEVLDIILETFDVYKGRYFGHPTAEDIYMNFVETRDGFVREACATEFSLSDSYEDEREEISKIVDDEAREEAFFEACDEIAMMFYEGESYSASYYYQTDYAYITFSWEQQYILQIAHDNDVAMDITSNVKESCDFSDQDMLIMNDCQNWLIPHFLCYNDYFNSEEVAKTFNDGENSLRIISNEEKTMSLLLGGGAS